MYQSFQTVFSNCSYLPHFPIVAGREKGGGKKEGSEMRRQVKGQRKETEIPDEGKGGLVVRQEDDEA